MSIKEALIHNADAIEEARVTEHLKVKTVALRDAELALNRAREEYRAALEAFNRHIAPVPSQ